MDFILRRIQSLTNDHASTVHQRSLGFFGAWQALDDDPVLLCDCDDAGCAYDHRPQRASATVAG